MKRVNEKGIFLLMNKNLIEIFINHLEISYAEMTPPSWHNVNFIDPSKSRKWSFRASYLSIESTIALKISALTSSMSRPTVCRPVRNFFRHSLNRCFFLPSFLKKQKKVSFLSTFRHTGSAQICGGTSWTMSSSSPILGATSVTSELLFLFKLGNEKQWCFCFRVRVPLKPVSN